MVREYQMLCDSCKRKGTERSPIRSFNIREDTGDTFEMDLCTKCWDKLVSSTGIRERIAGRRRTMVLTNPKDIR
jgi:hypothetical protein